MNKTKSIQDVVYFLMKVSLVQIAMMIIFATLLAAADLRGQEALERKVSIDVTNEEITEVLSLLEKQALVNFTYSPEVIKVGNDKVSIKVDGVALKGVLENLFGSRIHFLAKKNEIILKPNRKAATLNPDIVVQDGFGDPDKRHGD